MIFHGQRVSWKFTTVCHLVAISGSFPSLVNCCTIDWPGSWPRVVEHWHWHYFSMAELWLEPWSTMAITWKILDIKVSQSISESSISVYQHCDVPTRNSQREDRRLNVDSPPGAQCPLRFHEWPAEALYSVAKQQITGQSVELPNMEGALKMSGEPSRRSLRLILVGKPQIKSPWGLEIWGWL